MGFPDEGSKFGNSRQWPLYGLFQALEFSWLSFAECDHEITAQICPIGTFVAGVVQTGTYFALLCLAGPMSRTLIRSQTASTMTVLKNKIPQILLVALVAISGAFALAGSDTVRLQTFSQHSRISLRIDEGVGAKFSSNNEGFELTLSGASLLDLGAPLGEESRWKQQFASLKDQRVSKLDFAETSDGVRITGSWSFPKGADTLENPTMEFFDYRDKTTSRYVVDFWPKKGPTVVQAQVIHRKAKQNNELKEAEEAARKRAARRIASLKARQEAEDTGRICRMASNETNDVFLPAYGEHEPVNFARWIPSTTPDANFKYNPYEATETQQERKYAKLALKLYADGKPALAVRTVDFLDRDFPSSNYAVELHFLKANAMLKLGLQEEGERILNKLVVDHGDKPVALHSAAYLAVKRFERGQSLAALETFLWLLQKNSGHRLAWVFHLGAAEALYALKQTDRAVKEYQWVAENAPDRRSRAEGALRTGDLFLSRVQYDQALAAYYQALSRFQEEAKSFPSIHLNRAETLYWLGEWDRSEHAFKDFIATHPSHSSGWLATLRLGEIAGRSEDAATRAKGRDWFYETINRYPFTPSATLARLRLLPCDDHGGLNEAAAMKFLDDEARELKGEGQFQLTAYGGLRALVRVRTLAAFGREDRAVDAGLEELENGAPIGEAKGAVGHYLRVLFRRAVGRLLENGKKFEALALYDKQGRRIPPPAAGEADVASDYLLKLSQAASDLGLSQVAIGLAEAYHVAESRAAGRRVAAEDGLASDDLEVRIQAAEKNFSTGKAHWVAIAAAKKPDSEAYAAIRKSLSGIPQEASFSQQSEIIQGLMAERESKPELALTHAVKAQLLQTNDPRLLAWGARLQAQVGDPRVALEMFRNLENHLSLSRKDGKASPEPSAILGVPPSPTLAEVILAEAEQQEKLERWGDAALTYERAIGSGKGGSQAVYGYARALLNAGGAEGRGKAMQLLEKLAKTESSNDFWARLARQKLADERKREPTGTRGP